MKLPKRIFSFQFLVGLVVSSLAEEPFNGLFLDREMKPKKGVKVYVKDPKRYATTDKKGRFGLTDGSRSTRYDTSYSYDSMGNLASLTRNGRLDNGTIGKVNQLTYGYNGNQLVSVSDAVIAPSYNGFFGFSDGADKAVEYEYDANGNMTCDRNKGISSITYNVGNLPLSIQYWNGSRATYRYAAVRQVDVYYPYGALMAVGHGANVQRYMYNGKELDLMHGLGWYDYGARHYDAAIGRWHSMDDMCHAYYDISPYAYCGGDPVNKVDPTGKIIELPRGSTTEQILTVMWNMQQITDDKLVFNTQKDGSIRIKIASLGEGCHTYGTRLVRRLNSSNKTVTINVVNDKDNGTIDMNKENATNYKGSDVIVRFNPAKDPNIPLKDKTTKRVSFGKRPSYIGSSHELIHADRSMRGVSYDYKVKAPYRYVDGDGKTIYETIRLEESATIGLDYNETGDITENDIRKEHGLPLRGGYGNKRVY